MHCFMVPAERKRKDEAPTSELQVSQGIHTLLSLNSIHAATLLSLCLDLMHLT